jgi:hypothetical protein
VVRHSTTVQTISQVQVVEVSGRVLQIINIKVKEQTITAPLLHTHSQAEDLHQVIHIQLIDMLTVQGWIPRLHEEVYHQPLDHTSKLRELQVHVIWRLVEAHPFMPLASQAVAWHRQLLQVQDKELAILRPHPDTSLQHLQAMDHQAEAG